MGLSRTVSEIDGDFSRKSQNFPTPCTLHPAEDVPIGIGYRRLETQKNRMDATGPRKKFDGIFSRLDTMHQRTPGDSEDRAVKTNSKPCLMLFLST